MMPAYLFIGGCRDGDWIRIPELLDRIEVRASPEYIPLFPERESSFVEHDTYRLEYLHVNNKKIVFYVVLDMPTIDALHRLFNGYDPQQADVRQ